MHLLLGLFPSQPVDLRGAINVGDGGSQLDVLSIVPSSVSCTHNHPSSRNVQLNFTNIKSRSEERDSDRVNQSDTSSGALEQSPELQTLSFSL